MNRLELLKQEKEVISKMQTLSFSLKDQCEEWYDNEIRAIEEYGSANPEVTPPTDNGIMDMEWISCSEREPEKSGEYLITWTGYIGSRKSKPFLEIAEFSFDYAKSEWDVMHIEKRGYHDVEVLAWKELGEPWEGDV